MKKVLVISCFFGEVNTNRPYLAYRYFHTNNFYTKVIYSKFDHLSKSYRNLHNENYIGINPIPYRRNISIFRILSHIDFSIKVKKYINIENPDLIYINLPPNFLGYIIVKNAKKNKIKTIVDVIDIWPESLPLSQGVFKLFDKTIGMIWRGFRDYTLKKGDFVITESNYFKEKIESEKIDKITVIPLCKIDHINKDLNGFYIKNNEELSIAYLGAINNIYDFDSLIKICDSLKDIRKVKLYIIGDGERRSFLLNELEKKDIEYNYFGKVFDEEKKWDILSRCCFGFNGYKEITEVALSYKSIEYMSYGLPIINSAKGDTFYLVENEKIGINYSANNMNEIISKLKSIDFESINSMKKNSRLLYEKNFSWIYYKKEMDKVISDIKRNGNKSL